MLYFNVGCNYSLKRLKMKKKFILEQPPFTDKFRLLVDESIDFGKVGFTIDLNKIEYNLELIGNEFKERVDLHNLFTDKGITSVFPIGKYICVLELKKDKTKGVFSLFDFKRFNDISEARNILENEYSENIIKEWFKVYYILISEFSESEDLFELFVEFN